MGVSTAFFARFKKVIALVGSDREHERHVAADKAFELCKDSDLSFLEALDGAFGTSGGNDDDLLRQISELEDDNRKLAEAVELLNARQHVIPDNAGKEMLQRLWSYSQVRLLWTILMGSSFLWAVPILVQITPGGFTFYALARFWNWIFGLGTLLWFWEWAVAEFSKRGLGVTSIKGTAVGVGILVAVFGFHEVPANGVFILLVIAMLTVTNGASWVADKLQHSDNEWVEAIRDIFV